MKKILFLVPLIFLVIGCSKEEVNLENLLTEKMREDKELQDYNLSPDQMASCVVEKINKKISPYLFGAKKDERYTAYINFLKAEEGKEMFAVFKESESVFGSEEKARTALFSVNKYIFDCWSMIMPDNETG